MFKWKKSSAAEGVDLTAFAQRLLHYRKLRSEFFESEAIAAGGWDLLLLLYSAPAGAAVTVGSAAQALGAPSADVLGAAERVSHYRLAAQGDSPGNWEDIPLVLTAEGRDTLESYLRQFAKFSEESPAA